jgi:hypothetical protein
MSLTGRFTFRRTFWARSCCRSRTRCADLAVLATGARRRRWRDASLMDLAAVELRPLMDLRSRPRFDWERLYQPGQEEPRVTAPANDAARGAL